MPRSAAIFVTLLLFMLANNAAVAAPVVFGFEAPCVSEAGDGCSAFGLVDGDIVSGFFVFDESLVLPGTRLVLSDAVDFDFSFTFGTLVVSKVNGDLEGVALEVFFLAPDARELNALSGSIPSGVLGDEPRFRLDPTGLVFAEQVFATSRNRATATGSWQVPEPSTAALLSLGLLGLAAGRRAAEGM